MTELRNNSVEVKQYAITDDVEILGHVFHGLQDIIDHVEMSLYKNYSRGPANAREPKAVCEVHVGEMWMPYPCFDSSDYAYENRTFQNYILRPRPITQEDMKRLSDLPYRGNERRITEGVPADMLPMVYYVGDGNVMLVADSQKAEKYRLLTEQIAALIEGETDVVAIMANVSAAIHEAMGFFWTGFYRVKDEDELVLGPFQGSVACMHIGFGRGVCGTAWKERRTIVVPDVEQFPGHIACSSLSRSEIVVPVFNLSGDVVAVLDIDSKELSTFDETDRQYLEGICRMVKFV